MPSYTITLEDWEDDALSTVTVSQQEWIDNAITNRCRKAKDVIINKLVQHCNENNIALAVGVAAQVQQAFDLGIVEAAT